MVVLLVQNYGNLGNLTCFWVNGTLKVSIHIYLLLKTDQQIYTGIDMTFTVSAPSLSISWK
jgi:hypothetical protein